MSALGERVTDARILDLFAGSGALGLEALSRGAREVVFVEKARSALRALRKNVERLGAGEEVRVVRDDALHFVEGLDEDAFDVAFADPPYGRGLAEAVVEAFRRRSFARELWVEHRSAEPMPPVPGARTRRYGDTTLTTIPRPERTDE